MTVTLEILGSPSNSAVTNAWAFLVASHHGLKNQHPALQESSNFSFGRKPHGQMRWWRTLPLIIERVADRFKEVQIFQRPWDKLIPKLDTPRTLFVMDPPYVPDSRSGGQLYRHEMSVEDHQRMLKLIGEIDGRVVLCGYDNPLYREQLGHWRRVTFSRRTSLARESARRNRTEVVWMNYDQNGKKFKA